jgi:hypothetical protein
MMIMIIIGIDDKYQSQVIILVVVDVGWMVISVMTYLV